MKKEYFLLDFLEINRATVPAWTSVIKKLKFILLLRPPAAVSEWSERWHVASAMTCQQAAITPGPLRLMQSANFQAVNAKVSGRR